MYEIPKRPDIIIVNPIMHTYMKCSTYITGLALQYVAPEDFHQYSIDEFFMDMTASIHLFASNPCEFALKFKREIYERTRIESTIGIGPNLLLSKVAMDVEAKKNKDGIAQYPLKYLKQSFGVIGEELHLHSNGIDFSRIAEKYVPATTSIAKSQILFRDYSIEEFIVILLEHVEEVCYRLRREKKYAQTIHFSVGYSKEYGGGIKKAHTLNRATNLTMDIYNVCTYFLYERHTGEPIRSISISLTNLIHEGEEQISLFDNIIQREKEMRLTKVMDEIRTRFGKNSILRGISYTSVATARYRNTLLGGHKS
ncbi:DNA polymerase V [Bacillus cereus]|nr:DNA polymerase V [Bacillus cereus]